ncbi:MAG: transglutaminase-like domain-containing protein [Ilumatobacteraceae bacterium]
MDPATRFAEIVNGASAERHLDLLCALVATAIDRDADISSIILGLDRIADRCPATFEGIVDTLFASGMFTGDNDDYHDPRNSLLHEVLTRRVGMPITLSVVAIEVGKRLGVPIRGVGLPGHFVIRDKQSGTFADPFGRGLRYDEPGMVTSWKNRVGSDATFRPAMFAPTSAHEIMLRILNNLKQSLVPRDQPVLLARLVPLREAFPELASERAEHRRWMRHFN